MQRRGGGREKNLTQRREGAEKELVEEEFNAEARRRGEGEKRAIYLDTLATTKAAGKV